MAAACHPSGSHVEHADGLETDGHTKDDTILGGLTTPQDQAGWRGLKSR